MSLHTSYHADSDADDEYERSVIASPRLPTDSEASPTDSEPPSAEHTPTTLGNAGDDHRSPRTIITEWTVEECADFIASLGLRQYCNTFRDNEIVGEALIALKHEELKEMGITSVGHRLTILKAVYETKIKQDIPLDPDHYIPLSADQSMNETATQDDVARLIQSIRLRDERIVSVEAELRRVAEDYRRLREELLPIFKMAKDRSQPLPPPYSAHTHGMDSYGHDSGPLASPSASLTVLDKGGSGISRSVSKRTYAGGSTPKNTSPTHIPPHSSHDGRAYNDGSTLDPSAAAIAASSHLTASMNSGSQASPGMPSPTSPGAHFTQQQTLASRSYNQPSINSAGRSIITHDHSDDPTTLSNQSRPNLTPTLQPSSSASARPGDVLPSSAASSRGGPPGTSGGGGGGESGASARSVEIFKSFRVSMDDPCHKVLPAALKKYNITGDWRHYGLYIVWGDQERCLGLDERPLILFKQLENQGRKPMFMLRKQLQTIDGSSGAGGGGGSAAGGGGGGGAGGGPGGVGVNGVGGSNSSSSGSGNIHPSGGGGGGPSAPNSAGFESSSGRQQQQPQVNIPGGVL